MTFGEKIRKARNEAGYSQEELAVKIGVSRSAVAKWETDKGLPDITNIKAIAQLLNISIDYLLDDGSKLDLSTTRKSINLEKFTDGKITALNKKKIKDKVIRAEFPEAKIYTLIGEEKLTKGEKLVDLGVLLFTPLIDMVKLSKGLNNLPNEFYMVEQGEKQYLVVIMDEYMECTELANRITKKKFELGNYRYRKCGLIVQ